MLKLSHFVILVFLFCGCQEKTNNNSDNDIEVKNSPSVKDLHIKEEQASANNRDFDKYLNNFLDVELPLVIKGCNMNADGLTRLSDKTFGKYIDEYSFSFKRVPTNGDYLATIKLGAADCLLPILTTYSLTGDKIDEKSLAIGYCGSDCGYTCEEFMSIGKDFKIYVADTISQAECDSLYEIIPGTTENYIVSMNGMIHRDGTIELSEETKTVLK